MMRAIFFKHIYIYISKTCHNKQSPLHLIEVWLVQFLFLDFIYFSFDLFNRN